MEKTIYLCDHCGKELNAEKDYINYAVDLPDEFVDITLCKKCYKNLKNLFLSYIKKEKIIINSD